MHRMESLKKLEVFENKVMMRISEPKGGTEHEFGVTAK
jgi:hypothetical protein